MVWRSCFNNGTRRVANVTSQIRFQGMVKKNDKRDIHVSVIICDTDIP
jgi:hypothetical protein